MLSWAFRGHGLEEDHSALILPFAFLNNWNWTCWVISPSSFSGVQPNAWGQHCIKWGSVRRCYHSGLCKLSLGAWLAGLSWLITRASENMEKQFCNHARAVSVPGDPQRAPFLSKLVLKSFYFISKCQHFKKKCFQKLETKQKFPFEMTHNDNFHFVSKFPIEKLGQKHFSTKKECFFVETSFFGRKIFQSNFFDWFC